MQLRYLLSTPIETGLHEGELSNVGRERRWRVEAMLSKFELNAVHRVHGGGGVTICCCNDAGHCAVAWTVELIEAQWGGRSLDEERRGFLEEGT